MANAATRTGSLPIQMNQLAVNTMELIPQRDADQTDGSVPLQSMRQSDFRMTEAPFRCANPACTEDISEWRRECGMCRQTFCYSCTTDVRKLSATGQPDPLGREKRVCVNCSTLSWEDGSITDHKESFQRYRSERPKASPPLPPPPPKVETPAPVEVKKSSAVESAERLTRGYQSNCSSLKGLMADFKVPSWQKPEKWQSERGVKECGACTRPLKPAKFGQKTKVHCRLCGMIFCVDCTKNEILLYITDEGVAKWAINGREGGPSNKPSHFELLSICNPCCKELESAILSEMLQDIEDSAAIKVSDFSESLRLLQKQLMSLLHRVEELLMEHRKLSDSLWKGANESLSTENPLHQLAKVQCRLNGAMAQLSTETKKLQSLRPTSKGQEKLLKSISSSFTLFYLENMYLYRQQQGTLSSVISNDALQALQHTVCKVSMGEAHKELHIIMFNGLELKGSYQFSDTILMPIVAVLQACEEELKRIDQEFFYSHCQSMKKCLEKEAKENMMFSIFKQRKTRNRVMASAMFCHIAAAGLREILRTLVEKTVENECQRTKEALKNSAAEMESSENVFRQILTSSHASKVGSSNPEILHPPEGISRSNTVLATPGKTTDQKEIQRSNTVVSPPAQSTSKSDMKVTKPSNTSTSSKSP